MKPSGSVDGRSSSVSCEMAQHLVSYSVAKSFLPGNTSSSCAIFHAMPPLSDPACSRHGARPFPTEHQTEGLAPPPQVAAPPLLRHALGAAEVVMRLASAGRIVQSIA